MSRLSHFRTPAPARALPPDRATHRVLLAIHLQAEDEGLVCLSGDESLAASASVTPDELNSALEALAESGWIEVLAAPVGADRPGRSIVLMDHEAARWYVAETRAATRVGDRQ